MTYQDVSAHTHCDQPFDDPGTAMRCLRRSASVTSVVVTMLSLAGLLAGFLEEDFRAWNFGLAGLIIAVMTGAVAACAYLGELIERGRRRDREQVHCLQEQADNLGERLGEVLRRLAAVEAGERAIAGAVQSIAEPPDEIGQRRREGR